MEVNKLVITPIVRGGKGIVMKNLDSTSAQKFITERMDSSVGFFEQQKVPRKLPAWLRKFLNPNDTRKSEKIITYC
jgi:hypothetical protein